ncbi:permease [Planctobacterium marinum]|nr:FtsX-like permease family protein [Planctobacterium marinum]MCC2605682.1 permease [Planctobacterium marinum]
MLKQNIGLAWQFYHQEKRHLWQRFINWTQMILMVFMVTLSLTSASIQSYLTGNLNNLLGADLVLQNSRPLTVQQLQSVDALSEHRVLTQSIDTTLTRNNLWQRATLKAVAEDYPLQGELRAGDSVDVGARQLQGPAPGEIWLDARLMAGLSAQPGGQIRIAGTDFKVTKVLLHEPDRLMEGHNVQMRALINQYDLASLNFSEDRFTYRYLVAASADQIQQLQDWQKQALPAATLYHKKGAHPLALFWQRTENFIGLASIILFFMAAIALQQLTKVKLQKEQCFGAICQSLGASKSAIFQISMVKWLLQSLAMVPWVLLLSLGCHWALLQWLADTFHGLNWQPDWLFALSTSFVLIMLFAAFQLPVWLGVAKSSVLQLLFNQAQRLNQGVAWLCALVALSGIAVAYSDNGLLTAMVLGTMGVSIMLIVLLSWLVMTLGEWLTRNVSGLLPFAFFIMKQRLITKSTQILGVGLCAFLLLFTLMLLRDLGSSMANYQRQHDGNLLVSQASNAQMQDIVHWADNRGISIRQNKPFMYGKLISINGQSLADFSQKPSDSLATLQREIRLHWSDEIPANNELLQGQWWTANAQSWQQISVEQEVLTDLGLEIGDRMTFAIGEHYTEFDIVASHGYKPGAGSITFWVQMPTSAVAHLSGVAYSMASLELQDNDFPVLSQLWQKHPSLRMVSLQEMTQRFDNMLNMVTQVVSGFSLFIVLLAAIVILSSIQAGERQDRKKNSIILSFGFSRKTCLQLTFLEWLITGIIAASGAIFGTWLAGWLIYQSQFSMTWQPDFLWLGLTLLIITGSVVVVGLLASKHSLSSSVRELMTD